MKKNYLLIVLFVFGVLFFNINTRYTIASDDDGDGIDDEFEEKNKRSITIEFEEDQIEIESILRNGESIDAIEYIIINDSGGLHIQANYESEYYNESESEFELEFEVIFHSIIEYIDLDSNGIYNSIYDQFVQEVELDFGEIQYKEFNISSDCKSYCFIVNDTNDIFKAYIHLVEEFDIVNNTLITPTEAKIDIEINNFNYDEPNSQLALYVKLNSEIEYEEEDETEDEENGYATNEQGTIINNNSFIGFFTWNENVTVDGISKKIFVSNIEEEEDDIEEQKIYLNYPRGTHISHDPKIGIAKFIALRHSPTFFMFFIIIGGLIGAVSISTVYTLNHYRGRRDQNPITEKYSQGKISKNKDKTKSSQRTSLIKIFEGEDIINKLANLGDVNLTIFSQDFLKAIEQFDWEINDKEAFIKEMLALTPEEREEILKKMIEKKKL